MLICQYLKTSKVRIKNVMLITSLYDDIDFKCHFRLTRSSVEVSKLLNKISCYNILLFTI